LTIVLCIFSSFFRSVFSLIWFWIAPQTLFDPKIYSASKGKAASAGGCFQGPRSSFFFSRFFFFLEVHAYASAGVDRMEEGDVTVCVMMSCVLVVVCR